MAKPSVIMIGGEITLHGGETFDTRQQMQGEPWDAIQRAACFRSKFWWSKALEVASFILDDQNQDAWGLLWAPKSLYVANPDGSTKRTGLRGFVGSAVTADLMRPEFANDRSIEFDRSEARWRVLEHKFRFDDLHGESAPAVFVGGAHDFNDLGFSANSLAPFDQLPRLMESPLIVLPDTPLVRREIDEFCDWHRRGMPKLKPFVQDGDLDNLDDLKRASDMRPAVVDADLHVTRWIDEGAERSASDFDAAVAFRHSGSDESIGLLDLARNPSLYEIPLEPAVRDAPPRVATAPTEVLRNLDALVEGRREIQEFADEQKRRVGQELAILLGLHGVEWEADDDDPASFSLALGPDVLSPWGTQLPILTANVKALKGSLRLRLASVPSSDAALVVSFIESKATELENISGVAPNPSESVLASFRGHGWGDAPPARSGPVELVGEVLAFIVVELPPLIEALLDSNRAYIAEHGQWLPQSEAARTGEVSQSPRRRQRSGLWHRIFSR